MSKLKARSTIEVTACNPTTISASFNELDKLLRELGIADQEGKILESEGHRVVVVDEKGFSQRADLLSKGVVSNELRRHAATVSSTASWEHITATSWLPLSPLPCGHAPVGLTVPTKSANKTMQDCFPEAVIQGNTGGSNTTSIFNYFLVECSLII